MLRLRFHRQTTDKIEAKNGYFWVDLDSSTKDGSKTPCVISAGFSDAFEQIFPCGALPVHALCNQQVIGSSPIAGSIHKSIRMLEIILLWKCGQDVLERARKKGRRGWLWVTLLVCVWFSIEAVSAVAIVSAWQYRFEAHPDRFMIYVPSLFFALFGAILVGKVLDRQRSLQPEPPPIPPAISVFKFPCPHCGQRISAAIHDAGTDGNCPRCNAAFVVPVPSS
jgi:predicted RNA-binding Zn-ribbon protein involved in translation (DUF1610 family)